MDGWMDEHLKMKKILARDGDGRTDGRIFEKEENSS